LLARAGSLKTVINATPVKSPEKTFFHNEQVAL